MIVVADSGPLHYLVLLDQVDLLARFYGGVLIPEAVMSELSHRGAPAKVIRWLSVPPPWLRTVSPAPAVIDSITSELDLGEREAIALASQVHADLILIDEWAGRIEARRRGLRLTGTLGVLRVAGERNLIDVPKVLEQLQATNFYIDEDLIRVAFGKWLGS